NLQPAIDPVFFAEAADYSRCETGGDCRHGSDRDNSAIKFAANSEVLPANLRKLLHDFRHTFPLAAAPAQIAAVQADVVTHSMGGILTRNWTSDPHYRSAA